ncbi:MAG: hypothetical protein NUV77_15705 [Thermoguttaceae bacterium]|nr:hypothetical protein [Thermoguttaceae bacterium]
MPEERLVYVSHWWLLSIVFVVVVSVGGMLVNAWFEPRFPTLSPDDARLWELLHDPTMAAVHQEFLDREDYLGAAFQSLRMSGIHEYVNIKLGSVRGLEARPTPYEREALLLFWRAGQKDAYNAYQELLELKYGKDWRKTDADEVREGPKGAHY